MNIIYLKNLEENPKTGPKSRFANEGLSLSEIRQLESDFNAGNTFPIALKELLFLAGDFCPYLDYGDTDTQQEFQDHVRDFLGYSNFVISRPFMAVETCIGSGGWFDMIYLDEGDNPPVYKVELEPDTSGSTTPKIHPLDKSLSEYININIYASKVEDDQL